MLTLRSAPGRSRANRAGRLLSKSSDECTIWLMIASNPSRALILRITIMLGAAIAFILPRLASASPSSSRTQRRPTIRYFIATAYSIEGTGRTSSPLPKWAYTHRCDGRPPLHRYLPRYTRRNTGRRRKCGCGCLVAIPCGRQPPCLDAAIYRKHQRQRVKVVILKYGDDEAGPPDAQQKAEAKAANRKMRIKGQPAPTK